jgi:hypothetical protein
VAAAAINMSVVSMSAALARNDFQRWECSSFEGIVFSFFIFFLLPRDVAV